MKVSNCVVVAFAALCSVAESAALVEAPGKLESVTLYRGQALVTRIVSVEAPQGAVQLTVTGLPESVLGHSLFASSGNDVRIRAVRFRAHAVGEAPQAEVRELDAEIGRVDKDIRDNAHKQAAAHERRTYLGQLEAFVAPTATVEMSKGVLNAETLEKITDMMFERRAVVTKDLFELTEEARELGEKLDLLKRRRNELTRTHSKMQREAIVFLDKVGAGKSEIRLSYLVANATWSPTYNLRAGDDPAKVTAEFGALARQVSGEDWDGVELTLSTASAQMVAEGPTLAPLRLELTREPPRFDQITGELQAARKELQSASADQNKEVGFLPQSDAQWRMNRAVTRNQFAELGAASGDLSMLRELFKQQTSALSVNYPLDGKVSLASRDENQMVQIAKLELPAEFHYEATPLLTEYVYRYAELTNDSALALLEGGANVYRGGEFVGKANLPMVARGQKVMVGFGINPQLRATREFVSKKESTQFLGGNKEIVYWYRLVLENYSADPAVVRVLDRIPVQTEAIQVKLGALEDPPLSADVQYVRMLRPQGILRWDVTVPAKSAGESARLVEYSFQLEFDQNLHVGVGRNEPQAAAEAEFKKIYMEQRSAY